MKILVFVPVWKRPEITEICFMGINRLQKVPGFQIKGFTVISEESMITLCEKYGIEWCITKNHPLGAKKNYGVKQALRHEFDYLIEIGSDDLLKDDVLRAYKWDSPVLGLMDFALINTETGSCKAVNTNIPKYGAGRAIKRFVCESFALWEDGRSRGMDNSSCRILALNRIMQRGVKSEEPIAISLKSAENIWSYKGMPGTKYPLEKALSGLSEQEINAIQCLVAKNKSESLIER